MKIVLICFGNGRTRILDQVAQKAKEKINNLQPIAITFSQHTNTIISKAKSAYKNVNFIKYCYKQGLNKLPDMDYLKRKEEKYNKEDISLNWLIFSERYIRLYNKISYKQAMRILELNFRFTDEFLDKESPNTVVSGQIAQLLDYVLWFECKKRKINFLSFVPDRFTNHVVISNGPVNRWEEFEKLYSQACLWDKIPKDIYDKIWTTIDKYRDNSIKALCLTPEKKNISLINFFVYIKRRLRTADKDFTGIQPKYKVLSKGKEKIRKILLKKIINFIQLPKDNNYVYYPLHLEPEASTLYWAPFYFENQMAIAENIAKALPLGWYLYIKENPKMFGKRGISFYLYLKRFSNIKFISANLSGIDLIKKSKAVVTITGTSSLEAAFMGKPSFIFGDVFFDACPGVYRIKQWEGAREFIKRKIENFRYDEDRLIRFTWAYLNSLDKGMFCPPDKYPSVLNKENISNLTNALLKNI